METIASTSTEPASLHEVAELEATILRIFDEKLGLDVPEAGTDLVAAGTLDSLVLVRLLVALEEQLGTRIHLERLDTSDFRTISGIARFLVLQNGNGAGYGNRR